MFITFTIGLIVGSCLGVVFVGILNVNMAEEAENEMQQAYKLGYINGYEAAEKQYKKI